MKKIICLSQFLLLSIFLQAQIKVQFIVHDKTYSAHSNIHITGTFSNWDSTANPKYLLQPNSKGAPAITFSFKPGEIIRYKFHRGSWFTVEKDYNGFEVSDRQVVVAKDTVINTDIWAWRDDFQTDKWNGLAIEKNDSTRISLMAALATAYAFYPDYYNPDSALIYAQRALQLLPAIKNIKYFKKDQYKYSAALINLQEVTATLLHSLGNSPKALEIRLENLSLAEKTNDKFMQVECIKNICVEYAAMEDYQRLLAYSLQMDSILAKADKKADAYAPLLFHTKSNIATAYYKLNNYPAALSNARQAAAMDMRVIVGGFAIISAKLLADIFTATNQNDSALFYYRKVIKETPFYVAYISATAAAGIARVMQHTGHKDSALLYAEQSFTFFKNNNTAVQVWGENSLFYQAEIAPLLAELYQQNNKPDSAYKYLKLSITLKDSLYNSDKLRQFQTLTFNESARRQQLEQQEEQAKKTFQTKLKMYGLIVCIAAFCIVAFVQYRNNKNKQKANLVLQQQKQKVESTLQELQSAQKQLIQSEKMASLGELTAGIAHEIQNPLNFVNNFSEVNKELIGEMKEEIEKGNYDEVKTIAKDIEDNEEKINHHGKRADAIVKGMLQHSRSSNGIKEPTDINALCDEYLRLSYHGLRAKDKSFNATMKTDFDTSIGNINIIPQDIGRVILNLINNAFYAVDEKTLSAVATPTAVKYEPTVSISTKKIDDKVLISIRDNGNGIPQNIVDKIFQPFFTTKPTGQGTGLGLSLSYDIVKAHGGDIKVETKEGKGTELVIQLPIV